MSKLTGTVETRAGPGADWTVAVLNFPFFSGNALRTAQGAQAELQVGASRITVADRSELDLGTLDEHALVASEPRGALFVDLRQIASGESYVFSTPRGLAQIAADGAYEILAGDASTPTRLVVARGAAQFTSGTQALRLGEGQIAVLDPDGSGRIEALDHFDPFLEAMLKRHPRSVPEPAGLAGMTGASSLAPYGTWQTTSQYGPAWYPDVGADWAPYRDGSWSYVAPWGWTWIDDEPWGFAPFHYGRWTRLDRRWCWLPGGGEPEPDQRLAVRPVYAPALVDFLVAGAAAGAVAGSLSGGHELIGWVPLGPREAYHPPYIASAGMLRRLNPGLDWYRPGPDPEHRPHRRDERPEADRRELLERREPDARSFHNRDAATMVPAAAIAGSRPVRPLMVPSASLGDTRRRDRDDFRIAGSALPVGPQPPRHAPARVLPPAISAAAPPIRIAGPSAPRPPALPRIQQPMATPALPAQHAPMPRMHPFEPRFGEPRAGEPPRRVGPMPMRLAPAAAASPRVEPMRPTLVRPSPMRSSPMQPGPMQPVAPRMAQPALPAPAHAPGPVPRSDH